MLRNDSFIEQVLCQGELKELNRDRRRAEVALWRVTKAEGAKDAKKNAKF